MAFGLPKLAVAALLTVLLNPGFKQRIVLWTLPTLCLLSLVACTAVLFAQCSPVTSQWDLSITDRSCWSPWVLVHLTYFATGKGSSTRIQRSFTNNSKLCRHLLIYTWLPILLLYFGNYKWVFARRRLFQAPWGLVWCMSLLFLLWQMLTFISVPQLLQYINALDLLNWQRRTSLVSCFTNYELELLICYR